MTLQRQPGAPPALITNNLDTETQFAIDVDPALGFPSGLRCKATIPTTSGIPDVITFYLSAVPRTLSGITAVQGSNLMKDIDNWAKTSLGYA